MALDNIEANPVGSHIQGPLYMGKNSRAPVLVPVTSYGAVGDGVTDDTAAIQAAIDAAAATHGVVLIPPGEYVCNNAVLAEGVTLRGMSGQFGYLPGSVKQSTLKNTEAGWCLDTPATEIKTPSVVGLNISGPGDGVSSGAIRFRDVSWGKVAQVQINNFANEAIQVGSDSVACVFEDILTTNVVLTRTRAAVIGGIDLNGTDHHCQRIEASLSQSALASVNLYLAAIAIRGSNCFIANCVGEVADLGVYVSGSRNRITGTRADRNFGHGVYLAGGQNMLAACLALDNSKETTNTYSGFYLAVSTAQGNQLAACRAHSTGAPVHKYGFEDLATYAAVASRTLFSACQSSGHGTAPFFVVATVNSGIALPPSVVVPADTTATPDVTGTTFVGLWNYSTPTTITNFTGGISGQTIRVFGDPQVTLTHGVNIFTNTGADKTLATNTIYSFTYYNGKWYEAE